MKKELLVIENGVINKKNNSVFTGLYLQLYKNEIVGIIFDSTAERRCLLELLKGECGLENGRMYVEGSKIFLHDEYKYFKRNVAIIEKVSKLISTLDIAENIFLFSDNRKLLFGKKYNNDIIKLIEEFNLDLRNCPIEKLTIRERVIIELIKAYIEGKKIVVLSEITGFLKKNELADINELMKKLCQYQMSFIIIESFEDIVFEWTKQIFVIQNGRTVEIIDSKTVNRKQLYTSLLESKNERGKSAIIESESYYEGENSTVIEFDDVCTDLLENFNCTVDAGEVLKIYYLDDKSAEHILNLLKGEQRVTSGKIVLDDQIYRINSIAQAIRKGVCFIEEFSDENMLVYNMSVRDNIGLALSYKSSLIWLNRNYGNSLDNLIHSFFDAKIADMKLRKLEPEVLHKLVHFKWFLYKPKVIVFVKPFSEVDIHLQEITLEMIRKIKAIGIAVIILIANFSELNKIEGETIFIKGGKSIDENEVYQILYGNR